MDAAEIARLRSNYRTNRDVRALLDALEQARKERDELQGLKVTDDICFDRVVAQRDAAQQERDKERLMSRKLRSMILHMKGYNVLRDAAQQDVKEARALLGEAMEPRQDWPGLRARIEAMLEKKL